MHYRSVPASSVQRVKLGLSSRFTVNLPEGNADGPKQAGAPVFSHGGRMGAGAPRSFPLCIPLGDDQVVQQFSSL